MTSRQCPGPESPDALSKARVLSNTLGSELIVVAVLQREDTLATN